MKLAIGKIKKLTTRVKNKIWISPQIKILKKSRELRLSRLQTLHKNC